MIRDLENTQEIWKPVVNYEGFYEVSSFGRIRSIDREILRRTGDTYKVPGRLLKVQRDPGGYLSVTLHKNGFRRSLRVHRVVAWAFHGPPKSKALEVSHLNGTPDCNYADNLKWETPSDNCSRRTSCRGSRVGSAKLVEKEVAFIHAMKDSDTTAADLATRFNVDSGTIRRIWSGHRWNHVTGLPKPAAPKIDLFTSRCLADRIGLSVRTAQRRIQAWLEQGRVALHKYRVVDGLAGALVRIPVYRWVGEPEY